jgi:hypothetical protein
LHDFAIVGGVNIGVTAEKALVRASPQAVHILGHHDMPPQ